MPARVFRRVLLGCSLEGWGSGASTFGYATLLCNFVLCLAYNKYYRSMFTVKSEINERKQLVMGARIALGVLLVGYAANTLFLGGTPEGSQTLSSLLMNSWSIQGCCTSPWWCS